MNRIRIIGLLLFAVLLLAPATSHEGHNHTDTEETGNGFKGLYSEYPPSLVTAVIIEFVLVTVGSVVALRHYRRNS